MNAADWAQIIGALAIPIGGAVALLKWHISRLDSREDEENKRHNELRKEEIERQDRLRNELRVEMQRRIDELVQTVRLQGAVVNGLLGHIRLLEREMARAGLEIPNFDLDELMGRIP